jgi:hypothetical protein
MFVLSEYIFIISSYFIFIEPSWLKQIQKGGDNGNLEQLRNQNKKKEKQKRE